MTVGTSENLSFALKVARDEKSSVSAVGKLMLVLLADNCAPGAAVVSLDNLRKPLGMRSVGSVYQAAVELAQEGFLNISDDNDGHVFCAFPIATQDEVNSCRMQMKCDWRFVRGPGTT